METQDKKNKTIIVFSNDLDKALAAFNIAVGAAAMWFNVSMYFTFWGLTVLRKKNITIKGKTVIDKMFAMMTPKGATNLTLSKMHMMGIGTWMMKRVMRKKQVTMLPELIKEAKELGVEFIVCQMAMDMMGIKKDDLIDGIDIGGVASYLEAAEKSNLNLFI